MAAETGTPVFLPDYRLAPEHPFPAAIEDTVAGFRWLLDNGFPAENIVVSGDSAGGNLALQLIAHLEEADEASEAEEGPACYRDTVGVERFQGGAPHLAEVDVALGHVRTPSSRGSWPFGSIVSTSRPVIVHRSTRLSTGCGNAPVAGCEERR